MAESNCEQKEKSPGPKRPLLEIQHMVDEVITILSSDIYRLHKHNSNMAKMFLLEEWPSLNEEHVNAWRTAHELKSNTTRLLRSRVLIIDEDLPQFEAKVNDIKVKAVRALADFQKLQGKLTSGETLPSPENHPSGQSSLPYRADGSRRNRTLSESTAEQPDSMPNLVRDSQRLTRQVSEGASTEHSYEQHSFYDMVQSASGNVGRYAIPVAGGVLGSMFLGPVGLAIGVKLGAAAAVGGGIAGIAGGKMIQSVNDEMQQDGDQEPEDTGQVCKPLESPPNEEDKDATCETTTDAEEAEEGDTRVGQQDEAPVRDHQTQSCPESDPVLDPSVSPSKESVVPEGDASLGVPLEQDNAQIPPVEDSEPSKESVVPEGDASPGANLEKDNAQIPPAEESEQAPRATDPVLETRTAKSSPETRRGDFKCEENINTHRAEEQSEDLHCPVAPPRTRQTENASIDPLSLDPLPPDPSNDVKNLSSCEAEAESGPTTEPAKSDTKELDKPLPLVLPGEDEASPTTSLGLQTPQGEEPGKQDVSVDTNMEDGEKADSEEGGYRGFGVMKGISDFVAHPTKAKFAAVALPLAAGVAGTALAGPVGFIAGTKLAALGGAVTGGILGATTGTILQDATVETQQEADENNQQQNEGNDHEMSEDSEQLQGTSELVGTLDSVETVNQQPGKNETTVSADAVTSYKGKPLQESNASKEADEQKEMPEKTLVDTIDSADTATQQTSNQINGLASTDTSSDQNEQVESPGQNIVAREDDDDSEAKMGQTQLDSTTAGLTVAVENPETESECTSKVSKEWDRASDCLSTDIKTTAATDEGALTDTVVDGCPSEDEKTAQDGQQEGGYFGSKLSDFACFIENIDVKKAKLIAVPVLGGVIGSILAGPIGMVAGAKIGTVGAVGGGVLGMKFAETSLTSQTEPSGDTPSGKNGSDETIRNQYSPHYCAEEELSLPASNQPSAGQQKDDKRIEEKNPPDLPADDEMFGEQTPPSHSVADAKPEEERQFSPAKLKTD